MRRCAAIQPSYIPWRGYFHIIQRCDQFVFLDDVQYTKRDWRNRNRIKTKAGPRWLSVPIARAPRDTPIHQIELASDSGWAEQHWHWIETSYRAAPHFARYAPALQELYERPWTHLADLDIAFTALLCQQLGLPERPLVRSSELGVSGAKTARLLDICQAVSASHYLSGPAARAYIDPDDFARAEVELEWMVYDYEPYPQLYPPFDPQISVIDLLFMCGPDAGAHIWGAPEPS